MIGRDALDQSQADYSFVLTSTVLSRLYRKRSMVAWQNNSSLPDQIQNICTNTHSTTWSVQHIFKRSNAIQLILLTFVNGYIVLVGRGGRTHFKELLLITLLFVHLSAWKSCHLATKGCKWYFLKCRLHPLVPKSGDLWCCKLLEAFHIHNAVNISISQILKLCGPYSFFQTFSARIPQYIDGLIVLFPVCYILTTFQLCYCLEILQIVWKRQISWQKIVMLIHIFPRVHFAQWLIMEW